MTRTPVDSGPPHEGHPVPRDGLFHARLARARAGAPALAGTLLFGGFLVLLAATPVLVEARVPWAWMAVELAVHGLLAGWLALWALGGARMPGSVRAAWPAGLIAAACVAAVAWRYPQSGEVVLPRLMAGIGLFFLTLVLASGRARALATARVLFYAAVAHIVAGGIFEAATEIRPWIAACSLGAGLVLARVSDRAADRERDRMLGARGMELTALAIALPTLATHATHLEAAAVLLSMQCAGVLGIAFGRGAAGRTVFTIAALMVGSFAVGGAWIVLERPDFDASWLRPGPHLQGGAVVALAFGGAFALAALAAALAAQRRRRDPLMRGLAFACVMGVVATAMLTLLEFPPEVPSNAVALAVLLAFGWIALHPERATPVLPNVRAEE